MSSKKHEATRQSPTVLTLTLPDADSESKLGTLLMQRGDLARVHQFTYERVADLTEIIADALIAFAAVEADPPIISELPPPKPQPRQQVEPPTPSEPTVDIPLKKGVKAVKISHLKITGGETDAAAYRQAVLLAGKLMDGKLWDGDSPIRIDDVYALAKKMKHLTERDLSLFALTDFVQTGEAAEVDSAPPPDELDDDEDALTLEVPQPPVISSNGHHGTTAAAEQSMFL